MSLQDFIVSLTPAVFLSTDYFAEPITWTDENGADTSIKADVGPAEIFDDEQTGGLFRIEQRSVIVCTDSSEDCGGVDSDMEDLLDCRVTYNTVEYGVKRVEFVDEVGKRAGVIVERAELVRATRPGIRAIGL